MVTAVLALPDGPSRLMVSGPAAARIWLPPPKGGIVSASLPPGWAADDGVGSTFGDVEHGGVGSADMARLGEGGAENEGGRETNRRTPSTARGSDCPGAGSRPGFPAGRRKIS